VSYIPQRYKYHLPVVGYKGKNNLAEFRQWAEEQGVTFQIEQRRFSVKVTFAHLPNDPWTGPDLAEAAIYWVGEIIDYLKSKKSKSHV
jgi:hypothetical protein